MRHVCTPQHAHGMPVATRSTAFDASLATPDYPTSCHRHYLVGAAEEEDAGGGVGVEQGGQSNQ